VRTAPSSASPRPYSRRSCGPIEGKPKLVNEMAACAADELSRTARGDRLGVTERLSFVGDASRGDRTRSATSRALEALEFERDREPALRGQIELIADELEGRRVDEAAFAAMESARLEHEIADSRRRQQALERSALGE
jgi:hypothetical protein